MSVAETVGPSVEGRTRLLVETLLAATAAITGAAVAAAAALAARAAGLATPGRTAVGVVLAVAIALEAAWSLLGRPAPWSVRRQVPQVWSRLFGPATVAVLYGARLGIGPATILATWWWWAATAVSVAAGPGPAALVGATFGAMRVLVMHLAVARLRADGPRDPGSSDARPPGRRDRHG